MAKDLIVIKVWSNMLIDPNGTINKEIFENISYQINKIRKDNNMNVVLISSGAVWLGRRKLTDFLGNGDKTLEKQFFASIWQPYLMKEYDDVFKKYWIIISQALLTRSDFADREKYLSMRNVLNMILDKGILPIINENDVLSPEELDFSDNDQLGAYVAGMLGAKYLVLVSNIDWLYTMHPSKPWAKLIEYVDCINDEILKYAEEEKSSMWTGWMKSKLNTAQLMMNLGVSMFIVNGKQDSCLLKIVAWEKIGTQFEARECNISGIRRWLGTWASPKWKIKLCAIIQELLQHKKRLSILLSGVQWVYWDFEKWDVIEVIWADKKIVWQWISRYNSDELKTLYHKPDEQKNNYIVIHTDYFMHS